MDIVLKTKVEGYTAIMVKSKEDGLFTMSCLERGGAIIVAETKEECLATFKEAMGLAVSVAKLLEFGRSGTFNYKRK
jgi:predicted RNase H-like HicB family nuclease